METTDANYGWYSPDSAFFGYSVWTTIMKNTVDGKFREVPVSVTYVTSDRIKNPYGKRDPEARYVGALRKFVKRVDTPFSMKYGPAIEWSPWKRKERLKWRERVVEGGRERKEKQKAEDDPLTMDLIVYGSKRKLKTKNEGKKEQEHILLKENVKTK